MRRKVLIAVAIVAAGLSAALTFLPWVDLTDVGLPMRWTGLGTYVGDNADHYDAVWLPTTALPGWIVLFTSVLAAAALASTTRLPWARFVALGFALIALTTTVTCLMFPALLVDTLQTELGAESLQSRLLVNIPVLTAQACLAGVLLLCTALTALTVGPRRTPPADARIRRP
ncbi:hypothetical protein [Mycolicibacterium lutetiense]|uniref:DUF1772 domain-containing protein n=1 Tax=Mycolicibacterium lutetiense TaxID=1641992 RepID=A0ABS5A1C7_9MYCO|nr:hypothetical protein [Mycolicibacterium lutetiense]MBP2455572.1 hypothetical protein [Mycolicibacterium lutetiense]